VSLFPKGLTAENVKPYSMCPLFKGIALIKEIYFRFFLGCPSKPRRNSNVVNVSAPAKKFKIHFFTPKFCKEPI